MIEAVIPFLTTLDPSGRRPVSQSGSVLPPYVPIGDFPERDDFVDFDFA